jgi:hypothetical protein
MRTIIAVALALLAIGSRASAAESWVCAWPAWPDSDHRTVIDRFTVEGDFLVESNFGERYRILQNNEFSIFAVWSISQIEPDHNKPSIGGFVVIIGKKDGRFRRSNAILDEKDDGIAFGSCTH